MSAVALVYGDRVVCFGVPGTVASREPSRDGRVLVRPDGGGKPQWQNVKALRKVGA